MKKKEDILLDDKDFINSLNPLQLKIVEMAREIYQDYIDIKECENDIESLKKGEIKTHSLEEAKKITLARSKNIDSGSELIRSLLREKGIIS